MRIPLTWASYKWKLPRVANIIRNSIVCCSPHFNHVSGESGERHIAHAIYRCVPLLQCVWSVCTRAGSRLRGRSWSPSEQAFHTLCWCIVDAQRADPTNSISITRNRVHTANNTRHIGAQNCAHLCGPMHRDSRRGYSCVANAQRK